jgi:hypothetical protein
MASASSPSAHSAESGWRHFEIDASHNPHITAPHALMALLEEIVACVGGVARPPVARSPQWLYHRDRRTPNSQIKSSTEREEDQ